MLEMIGRRAMQQIHPKIKVDRVKPKLAKPHKRNARPKL